MLARFNSETFKLGWTQEFGHWSQISGACWKTVNNCQHLISRASNRSSSAEMCQCWDSNSKKKHFLYSKPCFFFLNGLRIHLFWVNCACQCCKFYPLPLSTNTSFLSSYSIANVWLFSGSKIYLASAGGKGNPQERGAYTAFFTAMLEMVITSYCFYSSCCVGEKNKPFCWLLPAFTRSLLGAYCSLISSTTALVLFLLLEKFVPLMGDLWNK